MFGTETAEQMQFLIKIIQESEWHRLFKTTYLSINPEGGDNPTPSMEYSRLLSLPLDT